MIHNSGLKPTNNRNPTSKDENTGSSIEDALVSDRIRMKQQLSAPLGHDVTQFAINIKPVKMMQIKENFKFTTLDRIGGYFTTKFTLDATDCDSFITRSRCSKQKNRTVESNDLYFSFSNFDHGICNFSFDSPSDMIRSPQTTTVSVLNLTVSVDSLCNVLLTVEHNNLRHFFTKLKDINSKSTFRKNTTQQDQSSLLVYEHEKERRRTWTEPICFADKRQDTEYRLERLI